MQVLSAFYFFAKRCTWQDDVKTLQAAFRRVEPRRQFVGCLGKCHADAFHRKPRLKPRKFHVQDTFTLAQARDCDPYSVEDEELLGDGLKLLQRRIKELESQQPGVT